MGWNTGILLFESTPAEAVQAALLPRAVPTGREQSVGEALGSREAVVGLGTWQQHTYLIDRYRALELTSQAANDPATNEPLAQLAWPSSSRGSARWRSTRRAGRCSTTAARPTSRQRLRPCPHPPTATAFSNT
jgi:hypothetical protein